MILKDELYKLLMSEDFISVQKAQAGICKALDGVEKKGGYLRVMRNNQPVGVLLPDAIWKEMLGNLHTADGGRQRAIAPDVKGGRKNADR